MMCVDPSGSLYFIATLPSPPGGTLNDPATVASRTTLPGSAVNETSHFWTPLALRTTSLVAKGVPGHHCDDWAERPVPWAWAWAIAALLPMIRITPARNATPTDVAA